MLVKEETSIYLAAELSVREISYVVHVYALMTRKSCAVGMRNAIVRVHLKGSLMKQFPDEWKDTVSCKFKRRNSGLFSTLNPFLSILRFSFFFELFMMQQ